MAHCSKNNLLFFLSADKSSGMTTVTFAQKRLKLHNIEEIREFILATGALSQAMKELLQGEAQSS